MKKEWEQIAFAVALAAFGWLLFTANTKASKTDVQVSPSNNNSGAAPWFLTYNSSAGLTGNLFDADVTSAGAGSPQLVVGMDNQGGADWTMFPQWVTQ